MVGAPGAPGAPGALPGATAPGVRLAVDVGTVRVGVAASDPAGVLASPVETLARGRGDLDRLVALVTERQAVEVLVGLPRTLAGREGQAVTMAREYAAALAPRIAPVPVTLVDERLTTVVAERQLQSAAGRPPPGRRGRGGGGSGRSRRSRRGGGGNGAVARRAVIDQVAAVGILQSWLDSRAAGVPGDVRSLNAAAADPGGAE